MVECLSSAGTSLYLQLFVLLRHEDLRGAREISLEWSSVFLQVLTEYTTLHNIFLQQLSSICFLCLIVLV